MRIGRRDSGKKPEEQPPADPTKSAADRAKDAEELQKLEEKYAGAKSFDWSKVKGPGKGKIAKQREEVKKKEKEEQAAAAAEDKPLAQLKKQLTKEQKIGAAVFFPLLFVAFYFLLRGDPGLGEGLTASQQQQMEQQSKKEMIDAYKALEKEYGADHPEVKQQREMMRQMKVDPK